MKIIIVGCGKIGATLIENLVSEGHDITVIDSNQKVVDEISNIYDVMRLEELVPSVICKTLYFSR